MDKESIELTIVVLKLICLLMSCVRDFIAFLSGHLHDHKLLTVIVLSSTDY